MKPEDIKVVDALDYASGTADVYGADLDMSNAEWAIAIIKLGTVATGAATEINWQQSDTAGSGYNDLAGTGVTIADDDDNQVFAIAITKPQKRYVRLAINKDASNAVAASATYIVGGSRTLPALANAADVTIGIAHSPAEGTP